MTAAQERARLLWLEGVAVEEIARTLGLTTGGVYRWRAALDWPKRPDPRVGKMSPVVALAAALWQDDVPRSIIAALCQVSTKSVDTWKAKHGWRRRSPGIRTRQTVIGAPLLRRAKRIAQQVTPPPAPRRLTRWECCGQRTERESCPICQRTHPLLAA